MKTKGQNIPVFGSGNWFWLSTIAQFLQWLVKGTATVCTCRK
jgi:hypothetical protein